MFPASVAPLSKLKVVTILDDSHKCVLFDNLFHIVSNVTKPEDKAELFQNLLCTVKSNISVEEKCLLCKYGGFTTRSCALISLCVW